MKTIKNFTMALISLATISIVSAQSAKNSVPPKPKRTVITFGIGGAAFAGETVNTIVDYKINDRTTIGGGATFRHSYHLSENLVIIKRSSDFDRLNIGARVLKHTGNYKAFDLYGGARIGATIDTEGSSDNPVFPSFQVIGGMRLTSPVGLGFNTEIALGSPYLISCGLSLEF